MVVVTTDLHGVPSA